MKYLDINSEVDNLSSGYKEYWTKEKKIIIKVGFELGLSSEEIEHLMQIRFACIKAKNLEIDNNSGKLTKGQIAKNNIEIKKLDSLVGEHLIASESYVKQAGDKMKEIRQSEEQKSKVVKSEPKK